MNQILSKQIQIADQVIRSANNATSYMEECRQIMSVTQNLAAKLQVMIDQEDLECFEPPIVKMVGSLVKALEDAVSLVRKCRVKGLLKFLSVLHAPDFARSLSQLESCIHDVDWILTVCYSNSHERLGIATYPPFLKNERLRALVWDIIASISIGPSDEKCGIAGTILLMAKENPVTGKLIVKEGGVECLLKLVEEGNIECQENSARAIGYLGRDQESVEYIIRADVCTVFAKILKQGPMQVQAAVAWAVSNLAASYPKCQDTFWEHNIVSLLIKHLSFDMVQERIPNEHIISKATSVSAYVRARHYLSSSKAIGELLDDEHNVSLPAVDPKTRDNMKAMAAKALCVLVRGNSKICRYITESTALACLVSLLEIGAEDVRLHSAMTLMEITSLVSQDNDFRRFMFSSSSPIRKIVIDQLVKIIKADADSSILIPCVKAIGNLVSIFRVDETVIIEPLVKLLDEREAGISREAVLALLKFCCAENYLCLENSKTFIEVGGEKLLVKIVYSGEQDVRAAALLLLCYIALNVPNFQEPEVPTVLEWASKQSFVIQDKTFESLLPKARSMF